MSRTIKIAVALLALCAIFAIKPHYGGEVTIRLNEPEGFSYSPSSYSNLVFYSLIYENFFYLTPDGEIYTHLFSNYRYDAQSLTLNLRLKDRINFSNGYPIQAEHVKLSLTLFLDLNLASSRKLRRTIKSIQAQPDKKTLSIQLMYDDPNVVSSLTTPELVLMGGSDEAYSGCFYPVEWVKSQYIRLAPNPYSPGGRAYLDSVKVVFYDFYYPDVFLSAPGMTGNRQFKELNAGVYQNMYLVFPRSRVGANTRVALYSLLKEFYKKQGTNLTALNALTSNEESPVTLNIRSFNHRRVRSILRYSSIKLFILSSLKQMEEPFNEFLQKKRLSIEPIYVSDSQLVNFVNNNSVKYLLVGKTFNRRVPLEEKIKIILKEMSFGRFNETYLKLLNQLDEVQALKNEELMVDLASRIIEKVINDGLILPLYQRRYSLYVKEHLKGLELDYYGKPLFRKVRVK
jgi:MarR-like DNA-binding transcriptional regulator SgrR of sgrS sRNA